jgi:hypothetical protein
VSLLGEAVVAIWNDVAPEGRDQFYEWHNHEHMPERVGIPGFLRGRRYHAIDAAPAYFTLYEAESASVLTGPHYVERLNSPTPATRHIIPAHFRNMIRGVCNVRFSAGVGIGGSIVALRFAAKPGREGELERHLAGVLPASAAMPMIAGAHLCVADASASTIQTSERKSHGAAVPDWLVMIEGTTPESANAACDALLASDLQRAGAGEETVRGLYGLEICLTKPSQTSS